MKRVRVAIAQIATLPSIRLDLRSGIHTYNSRGEDTPFLFLSSPSDLEDDTKRLHEIQLQSFAALDERQTKFTTHYITRLLEHLGQVIEIAKSESIELLVLPEYTVPYSAVGGIQALADQCQLTIIAGTHMLWRRELDDHPLRGEIINRVGNTWQKIAVCPVLSPEQPPAIIIKQVASRYEPDLQELDDPARECLKVNLKCRRETVKVAITICSEFLLGEGQDALYPERRFRIEGHQEDADLIVIPAWSPDVEAFKRKALRFLEERPHGNHISILLANTAVHGNSFILAPGDNSKTFVCPLSDKLEGLLIRDVPFGAGAGPAYSKPTAPPTELYMIEDTPVQRRLWDIAANISAIRADSSKATSVRQELGIIARGLPKCLQPVCDHCQRLLIAERFDEGLTLDSFRILRAHTTVTELVQTHLCAFYDYFSTQLRGGNAWQTNLSPLMFYLTQRLDAIRRYRPGLAAAPMTDQASATALDQGSSTIPGTAPGMTAASQQADWGRFVSENPDAEYHLCVRIVSLPSEDRGIAYQTRLVGQLLGLLRPQGEIEKVELRFVKKAMATDSIAVEVFLLFRFDRLIVTSGQTANFASQLFHICDARLLVYRFSVVDLKEPWFADFGADSALAGKQSTSRYFVQRREASAKGRVHPFVGKGEASSILYLQASQPGVNRLRIMLERPRARDESAGPTLEWGSHTDADRYPIGSGAGTGRLTGVIQTLVPDLQDLHDASLAVSFQPELFRPDTSLGTMPVFPAEIVFETDRDNLALLAEAIAFELAGPQHCWVRATKPQQLFLAERECFHIFRLPFGSTPGFSRDESRFVAPDKLVAKQTGGLFLGDVLTRKSGRQRIYWDDVTRLRHMHVIGKSGTGKSYFLSSLISRDIIEGNGVIVIDPHGDLIDAVLPRIPLERAGDVIIFDPGDTAYPPGLNLFEANLGDHFERSMVMEEAVSLFLKLYGSEIFGPRIQQYFRGATLSLMDYGYARSMYPTLLDIARIFLDRDFRDTVKRHVKDRVAHLFWKEVEASAERETREMIPYFQAKFGSFLSNKLIRNVIGQQHSIINFRTAIEQNAIVLVNLSKGRIGDLNASLLGLILIAKLNWAIMGRASVETARRGKLCLYVDEFQNLASNTFCTMLSEARKYGLSMVLSHQYLSQLKVFEQFSKSDPDGLLHAITGNVGTVVAFQLSQSDGLEVAKEMRIRNPLDGAAVLQKLPDYTALIATSVCGERMPASLFYSLPWTEQSDSVYGKELERFVKLRSCEVLTDVERGIEARL